MTINFATNNPSGLLAAFKKAIDDKKVETWSYDSDGDFTHTPPQWKGKAWLRPTITAGRLTFSLLGRKTEVTTWEVYAVYHGRFIETMVVHCNKLFTTAEASAAPTASDTVTARVA